MNIVCKNFEFQKIDTDNTQFAELLQKSQDNSEFKELLLSVYRKRARIPLSSDKDTQTNRLLAIIGMQEALIKGFYKRNDVFHACEYYNINGKAHNTRVEIAKKQEDLFWFLLSIVRDNLIKDPDFNRATFLDSTMYQDYLSMYNSYASFLIDNAEHVMGKYNFEYRQDIKESKKGEKNVD